MPQDDRADETPTRPGQNPLGRIGGACCVCRAKKRKCSGEKGLPKHHIRKLEARLRRTEALLRGLLEFVSDAQLESSLRGVEQLATPESSVPQDKENADPAVWQAYPLTTLEDVRAWQSQTGRPEVSGPPATRRPDGDVLVEGDRLPSQDCDTPRQSKQSPRGTRAVTSTPVTRAHATHDDHRPANFPTTSSSSSRDVSLVTRDTRSTGMARANEPSPPAGTFLPEAFQEEFLW